MTAEITHEALKHFKLQLPAEGMSEEKFLRFCEMNDEVRIERDSNGTIFIMAPLHTESGGKEADLIAQVYNWNHKTRLGRVFSSSAGFTLPNGAMRSPDVSWISKERYDRMPKEEWHRFAHICPDFVIELRSGSDTLKGLQKKMEEWRSNGCRLGFLIDPFEEQAYIYRQGAEGTEAVSFDATLSGEDVLPGFELELSLLKD